MSDARHNLIVISLRGGADGLSLVPPLHDTHYFDARPTLAVSERRAIPVDDRFGLHPALAPLRPLLAQGELAIVHACGSDDSTRSHFEATDRMEQAGASARSLSSGWIARHLATRPGPPASALAGIAIGQAAPESLRGVAATAIASLDELTRGVPEGDALEVIGRLYRAEATSARPLARELAEAAQSSLDALEALRVMATDAPLRDVSRSAFEQAAALAAELTVRRDALGCEVITLELDGWDTHFASAEIVDAKAGELARGLALLRERADSVWQRTTVIVMSEFGRRLYENVSLGTDHGRGGVAFVLGGGLTRSGMVGPAPLLHPDALEPPGDVAVRTDFRSLLWALLEERAQNPRAALVFPGFQPEPLK